MKTSTALRIDIATMAIRRNAGGDTSRCTTCCRAADAPYRRIVDGKIVEGCVDAAHGERLATDPTSNTAAWHFRPAAIAHRRETLAWLRSL